MKKHVATIKLWQRWLYAAVLLVLCGNVTQVHAADMALDDAMSNAGRHGMPDSNSTQLLREFSS